MTEREEITGGQTYCAKNAECVYWGNPDCPFFSTGKVYSGCTANRTAPPNKREEIKEGMAGIELGIDDLCGIKDGHTHLTPLGREKVLRHLRSQDVVIRVDEPLPSAFDIDDNVISALEYKKKLAGYVAFVPLIEEVSDGG